MGAEKFTDKHLVELTPEQRGMVLLLATHAAGGALDALREGRYGFTPEKSLLVVSALRLRDFAVAALVAAGEPDVSDLQLVAAARLTGRQAVYAALGPPPAATVN